MPLDTLTPIRPSSAKAAIRVFLAEDHSITLWGLQRLVEASRPHLEVAGTATSCQELIDHPALAATDVLVLDLNLAGRNATELFGDLQRRCSGRILILTGDDNPATQRSAILKGARGVLHKSMPADSILRAIETVHAGEIWLERGMLSELLGNLIGGADAGPSDPTARRIASLTPREREIVGVMARSVGAKLFSVADQLGMSEHTLRNHLTTIYAKLGVRGRLELHVFANEHGLARP